MILTVLAIRELMEIRDLIATYLKEYPLISIATVAGQSPWISNVYFSFNDQLDLFFISRTFRRHSKEIAENPSIAASICKPHMKPFEMPCRGLQIEGKCRAIEDSQAASIALAIYMDRFPASRKLHASIDDVTGSIDRRIYQIEPQRYVLFDEENFSTNPQQELIIQR